MQLSTLFFTICGLSLIYADDFETEYNNLLIDNLIAGKIKKHINELEPLRIQNYTYEFNRRWAFGLLPLKGHAKLEDIELHGLSTIQRIGPVKFSSPDEASKGLEIVFEVTNLTHSMTGNARLGLLNSERNFTGHIKLVEFHLYVKHSKARDEVYVQRLMLTKLDGLDVQVIGGYRINDWLTRQLITRAHRYLQSASKYAIEFYMTHMFNVVLSGDKSIKYILS